MKRLQGWIVLLIFFFFFLSPAGGAERNPFKIGVNLELTGPWAEVTKTLKRTMILEAERINAAGGIHGRPLDLLFEDNGFDLNRAATLMTKFSRNPEVLAVIGPFEDNLQATTRAIAEREKITDLIICPSNPTVRALKQKWSFNVAQNDIAVSQKLVDLARARHYQRVVIFHAAEHLATSLAVQFKRFGEEQGIRVDISRETHKITDIDMTSQLIKLKPMLEAGKADALYAATYGPSGPIVCKTLRSLGLKTPVLGTHAFGFGFVIALGGEAMEGVEFAAGKPVVPDQLDENDPVRPLVLDLDQRLKARYGVGVEQIAGHAYDAVRLVQDALKRSGAKATRETLRDALENTKGLKSCHGIYHYSPVDHDGLSKKDLVFIRIENQRFKRVKFPGFE